MEVRKRKIDKQFFFFSFISFLVIPIFVWSPGYPSWWGLYFVWAFYIGVFNNAIQVSFGPFSTLPIQFTFALGFLAFLLLNLFLSIKSRSRGDANRTYRLNLYGYVIPSVVFMIFTEVYFSSFFMVGQPIHVIPVNIIVGIIHFFLRKPPKLPRSKRKIPRRKVVMLLGAFAGIAVLFCFALFTSFTWGNYQTHQTWGLYGSEKGQFNNPEGIAVNNTGYVYVLDTGNTRVQIFAPNGEFVKEFGSNGTGDGQFRWPTGIAINGTGHIYVVGPSDSIQVFTAWGEFVSRWSVTVHPRGIAINATGNVFVTDIVDNEVYIFTQTGNLIGQLLTSGGIGDDFLTPCGIAINASGYVYVTDRENHRIQVFSPMAQYQFMWGTHGLEDDQFDLPHEIAIDSYGRVYVVDRGHNLVQVFSSTGQFLFKWGIGVKYTMSQVTSYNYILGITINASDYVFTIAEIGQVQVYATPLPPPFTINLALILPIVVLAAICTAEITTIAQFRRVPAGFGKQEESDTETTYVEDLDFKIQQLREKGVDFKDFLALLQEEGLGLTPGECIIVIKTARELLEASEKDTIFNEVQKI